MDRLTNPSIKLEKLITSNLDKDSEIYCDVCARQVFGIKEGELEYDFLNVVMTPSNKAQNICINCIVEHITDY